jgi:hypothetical protein
MVAICSVHGGYHHYSVPLEDDQWARRCECGEIQRYKPHVGKPSVFTDVLVEAEDLRELIDGYRGQAAMPDAGMDELCDRLELLYKRD